MQRSQLVVGAALVALVAGGVGYGTAQARLGVHHEQGVECLSMKTQISCELEDGWTVAVPVDVRWGDDQGEHDGSRPSCLPPTGRGLEGPVELAWVPVEADGTGWRQVVWVTC